MILPHHVWLLKSLKKKWWVGLIKICFYTQYKTVLLDRLFLLDIFHIPLRCNRTKMREIILSLSFVLINGTVTFVQCTLLNKIHHFWPINGLGLHIPGNESSLYQLIEWHTLWFLTFSVHCETKKMRKKQIFCIPFGTVRQQWL